MKSDFLLAITQLAAEKNLSKEVVLNAIESALVSAYRRDSFAPNQELSVKINPNDGSVTVWASKIVAEALTEPRREISLEEARRYHKDAKIGDTLMVEATPHDAGRIAAQTAKQVILQRLHEAEHSAIFAEFSNKEGEVVTGSVQRIEPGQIYIDLSRTEAILPASEQVRTERYRPGQRLKVLILHVAHTARGARVIVSRSHPDLLRRLIEIEVPEVYNGQVEIKAISREAGFRSKVAVAARQEGIDPVGCCVGLRGIRIQNIVSEMNGEKIDVVTWDPDPKVYIANALSPAQIVSVELNKEQEIATVVVPDKLLSLAIGKEGQNARLAAKLTGWRIDIKSASIAEAERLAAAPEPETKAPKAKAGKTAPEPVTEEEAPPPEIPGEIEELLGPEPGVVVEPVAEEKAVEEEEEAAPQPVLFEPAAGEEKSPLRFAEDILDFRSSPGASKSKKKKKKGTAKDTAEDGIKLKKARRGVQFTVDEEEY